MHDSQNGKHVNREAMGTVTQRQIVLGLLINFMSSKAVPISNKNSKAV